MHASIICAITEGSETDPDRSLRSSGDKATRAAVIRYFLRRVLGGQLRVSYQLGHQSGATVHPWPLDPELFWIVVAQLVLWATLTLATGRWWI